MFCTNLQPKKIISRTSNVNTPRGCAWYCQFLFDYKKILCYNLCMKNNFLLLVFKFSPCAGLEFFFEISPGDPKTPRGIEKKI